ncbi:DUF308 domain-containing protein [uncultured Gemmiger sp.]|uniref:HdeD family acid-resistance protein n=1 Tax=uncultured Gemmiger sp. TaxID=1623490 RepID=UPI0025EAD840|nr:DUF308 domain-containing protein [uncultured Gemmiger sp.]
MLHHLRTGMLVLSVLYFVLGLALLAAPAASLPWVCAGFGLLIALTGARSLWRYSRNKEKGLAAWFTLAGGVVTLALGLFALLRPDFVQWVLPVVFGVFLLVDGAAREQSAWALVRRKGQRWWVLFVLGFVTGIAGILLILQPFSDWPVDSIWLSGLLLIIEGVLNAGCTLYTALLLHDLDKAAEAPAPTDDGEAPADPDPSDPQS